MHVCVWGGGERVCGWVSESVNELVRNEGSGSELVIEKGSERERESEQTME